MNLIREESVYRKRKKWCKGGRRETEEEEEGGERVMYLSEPVCERSPTVTEKECIVYHCILRAIRPGQS